MRTLTIVTSLAVLTLGAAGTAGATAPTTTHQSFPRSIPHYLPCPGFWIDGEFQIDRTTTTFYDQAGTAIRRIARPFRGNALQSTDRHVDRRLGRLQGHRREAIRCLKRLLARAVFNALKASPPVT